MTAEHEVPLLLGEPSFKSYADDNQQGIDVVSLEALEPRRSPLSRILKLAVPLALQNVFGYAMSVISAIAVGRMNNSVILSSVVLAGSFYNVTGLSIMVGLSAGCDTIAGQAFGAGNYLMVGETLQRALLICFTVCCPIVVVWLYAVPLLTALHQSPEIIAGASRYLQLAAPTLFVSAISQNINKFFQAQRVVQPGSVCTAITAAVCPLYNWFFIYRLNLGLEGAALAFFASNATYSLLMVLCMVWLVVSRKGSPQQTWPGFTSKAFSQWGQYLQYGLPAAAMICCEWWVFELAILMAGSLPEADIAVSVMGILFHITCVCFMLPYSVGTACNTCIANELGAGNAKEAKRFFKTGLAVVCVIQTILGGSMHVFRASLPRLFTGAPEVLELAAATMTPCALCVMADGLNSMLSGVLRGAGRQAWGAALNLIGYWCVGFPLAVLLGFKFHLSTVGFWAALACASWLQVLIQITFISRLNWQREVERAEELVGKSGFSRTPSPAPDADPADQQA